MGVGVAVTPYLVNEIFYSLQGEGARTGTPNVFVRFSGCNRECRMAPGPRSIGGFDCDTDFANGRKLTATDIFTEMDAVLNGVGDPRWVIFTGGEPGLQLDKMLVNFLKAAGWRIAVETNGSVVLPEGLDWITVSPKMPERELVLREANEVKYVRAKGQGIPQTSVAAPHKLISPAFAVDGIEQETLAWCVQLVKENPGWRLSVQQHKLWGIR